LIIIIAGLGSIRSCGPSEPNTGCAAPPPTTGPGPTPAPPVVSPLKQYTVQVATFTTKQEAENSTLEFRRKNINVFILSVNGQWLVCVGQYASASRANKAANTLKSRGISEAKVLPPQKK
jgi:septal ring-binding cell division protein DamX